VADYCSCGTQLVEDALFCHKCGKPTRELVAPETVEPPVAVSGPPPPLPMRELVEEKLGEIGFSNRLAVRTAMTMAAVASLLTMFPGPAVISLVLRIVGLPAAGFLAVYLYKRRTGMTLTVKNGARMGWLTGLFSFLVALVTIAIGTAFQATQGTLASIWKRQLEMQGGGAEVQEALRILESPAGIAVVLLLTMVMVFFFFTSLTMIGGALCAKVLEKD